MAALLVKNGPDSGKKFCAGTLYRPDVILTAAHCVTGREARDAKVVVGRTVLSDAKQGQVRAAVSFKIHPRYDQAEGADSRYDMALIELAKPVKGITPVQLPTPGTDALIRPGAKATVAGWGLTDDVLEHTPDRMRQVKVPILSQAECQRSYNDADLFDAKVDICAGTAGKGSCRGDSGGPLFRQTPGREEPIQIGIVSGGGKKCAAQGQPGIYTSLSSKKLWNTFDE